MKEYDLGYATVRIHDGKLSEEQRKEVLIDASTKFYRAIQKAQHGTSGTDSAPRSTQTA